MRILVAVIAVVALACAPREPAARASWDATLAADLLRRGSEDQSLRQQMMAGLQSGGAPDSSLLARIGAVDSANTEMLRETVAAHGWPDQSVVGREGASAAFLIVQHASYDTAFQAKMPGEILAAFDRGEADGQSVALLTDRPHAPRSLEEARRLVAAVVAHRNTQRLHSAIGYVTPADKLAGRKTEIWAARDQRREAARERCRQRRAGAAVLDAVV